MEIKRTYKFKESPVPVSSFCFSRKSAADKFGVSYDDLGKAIARARFDPNLSHQLDSFVNTSSKNPFWVWDNVLTQTGFYDGDLRASPLFSYSLGQASDAVGVRESVLDKRVSELFGDQFNGDVPGWAVNLALGKDIFSLQPDACDFLSNGRKLRLFELLEIVSFCRYNRSKFKSDMGNVQVDYRRGKQPVVELNKIVYCLSVLDERKQRKYLQFPIHLVKSESLKIQPGRRD